MTPDEQQEMMRRMDWLQKRVEFVYIVALLATALAIAAATYFAIRSYLGEQNAMWVAIAINLAAGWILHLGTKHGPSPGPK